MNVSIIASGTRGDVQPYVALGQGLQSAGHTVRLLTSDDFQKIVESAGLTFCSIGPNVEAVLQSPEWRKATESGNFLAIIAKMTSEMKKRGSESARQLPELLKGTELLVAGVGGLGGAFTIAQKSSIPIVQAYLFPLTPTRRFPSPIAGQLPPGSPLNWPSFHLLQQLLWQSVRSSDDAVRRELGLGAAPFWGRLPETGGPVLYGFSPDALPRPDDWPTHCQVTGYWFLKEGDGLPKDLTAFLDAGTPPVYIGFGSMGNRNPEETARIAIAALERAGLRGVLATGWGGMQLSRVPDTVFVTPSVPHGALFPRMAAVVHHGGAGTTAAGLRAGVPSIVVPFFGDQPFWGRRVRELGVGPAPIPRRKLTVERLAAAMARCVGDQDIKMRASVVGQAVHAEEGVARAIAVIEAYAGRRSGNGTN